MEEYVTVHTSRHIMHNVNDGPRGEAGDKTTSNHRGGRRSILVVGLYFSILVSLLRKNTSLVHSYQELMLLVTAVTGSTWVLSRSGKAEL